MTLQVRAIIAMLMICAVPMRADARTVTWGVSGDIPVPADFDGDGHADIAIWRPSTGYWYILQSATNTTRTVLWGQVGDVAVPADYDGDGKTDIAIWRPNTGYWWIFQSATNTTRSGLWGQFGDIPVPQDYDLDGKWDVAVWRQNNGTWYVAKSTGGSFQPQYGAAGDVPLPRSGSYGVYRPSTGAYYFMNQIGGGFGTYSGGPTSGSTALLALLGNRCDIAKPVFWNRSTGGWSFPYGGLSSPFVWGAENDLPIAARFDGANTPDLIGVFRPSNGTWYIRETQTGENICLY